MRAFQVALALRATGRDAVCAADTTASTTHYPVCTTRLLVCTAPWWVCTTCVSVLTTRGAESRLPGHCAQHSSLELSDTKVYEPLIRVLLGTASHFCEVVVVKLISVQSLLVTGRDAKPMWVVRVGQSTLDAVYVYVVPWSEFRIVPSYPHYPQAGYPGATGRDAFMSLKYEPSSL